VRKHIREDEEEQQWLHADAEQKWDKLTHQYSEVAKIEAEKGLEEDSRATELASGWT
jgi:hypothetical protein